MDSILADRVVAATNLMVKLSPNRWFGLLTTSLVTQRGGQYATEKDRSDIGDVLGVGGLSSKKITDEERLVLVEVVFAATSELVTH